ncbi:hypothetical protein OEZ86_007228 [Tetradesmus obliquus]|nr:hypothetical protein OEZ86_007228 [Tetradesmus obliquus]
MLREDIVGASSASAEFLGTLLLQLFAGSTLVPLRIAAVFAALMATFARHSGGHLNPGISLAAALSGHLAWAPAAMYMLAQVLMQVGIPVTNDYDLCKPGPSATAPANATACSGAVCNLCSA